MIRIGIAAAVALAITLPAVSAQAQATRAFVSAAGSDSNNCINVLTPCRHFQAAYNAMSNGGEIDVLDPANYGALTVTHKLSIVGRGWATLSPVSGAAAITINAGSSDTITISGVQLDGAGTTSTNGIVFNSGSSLTVTNSVLENFVLDGGSDANTGNGILLQPAAGTLAFTITNTTASNNGGAGIYYFPLAGSPTVNGVIDHVVADANQLGIAVFPGAATGGSIVVTISDSIASNNSSMGIVTGAGSATLKVSIDNVTLSGNSYGIFASTPANVLLGRSVITGNSIGVQNDTSGTFGSYQDNRINLNTTSDVSGPLNVLASQ
jgi:Right handed beta helix region